MFELAVLSGRRASTVIPVPRFPCSLGRSGTDVALDEPGIAPHHATLALNGDRGIDLEAFGEAMLYSDGKSLKSLHLKNGTTFELGGVRLQFRIQPAKPRDLGWLEWSAMALLGLVATAEILWIIVSPAWP